MGDGLIYFILFCIFFLVLAGIGFKINLYLQKIKLLEVNLLYFLYLLIDYAKFRIRMNILNALQSGILVKKKENSFIDLTYHDDDEIYVIRMPKRRGPRPFTKVLDHQGNDVTKYIKTYMGPNNNFHGVRTTPKLLGFESLSFQSKTLSCKNFSSEEDIIL